jgi:hypothetical protein
MVLFHEATPWRNPGLMRRQVLWHPAPVSKERAQ